MSITTAGAFREPTDGTIGELPATDTLSAESLLEWLAAPVEPILEEHTCHDAYLMMSPVVRFLKNLPLNTLVFEGSNGGGSVRVFRDWLGFERKDLRFFAASSEEVPHPDGCEGTFVGDIEQAKPVFTNERPNAAVVRRLVERLRRPDLFLLWLAKNMPSGARLYLEWPATHTANLPPAAALRERGYDIASLNFKDDARHLSPFTIHQMISMLRRVGFETYNAGYVDMPFIADSLKSHGIGQGNPYYLSAAIQLKTLYHSFVMAVRR